MSSQPPLAASGAQAHEKTHWLGVTTLAGTLGLRMLGLFMVLPVLALYVERLPGGTALLVGLAMGIYGLTQAVLQLPMGWLSDRIGRKPVIVAGLLVFAAGSLLAWQAETAFWLVMGRALQGAGAISAVVTALVGDLTAPALRTRAMALIGISIGSAFLLAFIVGPLLASVFGVDGLFLLTALLATLSIVPLLWLVPDTVPAARSSDRRKGLRSGLMAGRAVMPEALMALLLHALLTAVFLVVPGLLVERLGLPVGQHGQVYAPIMLASLLPLGLLMLIQERLHSRLALGLGVVLLGLALGLWLLGGNWPVYAGLLCFFGGFNFVEAHLPARVSLRAEAATRGAAMGWYSTGQFAGAFVGGLGGGILLQHLDGASLLVAGILLTVLWLVALLVGQWRGRQADT
ncbi:MAG: MFS transporter [Gammaproteobacteria bacterium]|nr:MFS transporter [Gammaproteobacteria bacterium]